MRSSIPFVVLVAIASGPGIAWASSLSGTWPWPVIGPVIQGYDPPLSPYGAGHRGIDIAAPYGTPIAAPAPGTVSFSGKVGGQQYVTIDHGGGLATTYSWVSSRLVRKGDRVAVGQVIALTGWGHPGSATPHLHLGAKLSGAYIDPMTLLAPLDVSGFIRLAPLGPGP